MLQSRQLYRVGNISAVHDEHIIFERTEDAVRRDGPDAQSQLLVVETASGLLRSSLSIQGSLGDSSCRMVFSREYIIKYFNSGVYHCFSRKNNQFIAQLSKPTGDVLHINCACASNLSDGVFFFSYAEDSSVHAIVLHNGKAVISPSLKTIYRGSGFLEKPKGRIVALSCHPTKQYLFVVYSQGTVQVRNTILCLSIR